MPPILRYSSLPPPCTPGSKLVLDSATFSVALPPYLCANAPYSLRHALALLSTSRASDLLVVKHRHASWLLSAAHPEPSGTGALPPLPHSAPEPCAGTMPVWVSYHSRVPAVPAAPHVSAAATAPLVPAICRAAHVRSPRGTTFTTRRIGDVRRRRSAPRRSSMGQSGAVRGVQADVCGLSVNAVTVATARMQGQ
ncbi:hypothetical protein C8R44DRAFT_989651 [Mycena epipterygia]|nr:hypothetical protein C8R44DRAFT_990723 [Mycena epipterygia]KAJ7094860.1 hypothetical protein C8R44DRAFT_989651 [Mycena epipterygia]